MLCNVRKGEVAMTTVTLIASFPVMEKKEQ